MPKPEGYRKALRLMQLAAKFRRPIVTLVDTPGAYPGIDAEERGQAEAIAYNLREMSRLATPIVTVIIGEGGSGGALGIGVANRVYMLENAYYSVITPESCAAIIWRDSGKAPLAAAALRLTAPDLLEMKLIDGIVPEPPGGAHLDPDFAIQALRHTLRDALDQLSHLSPEEVIEQRYTSSARWAIFSTRQRPEQSRIGRCAISRGDRCTDRLFHPKRSALSASGLYGVSGPLRLQDRLRQKRAGRAPLRRRKRLRRHLLRRHRYHAMRAIRTAKRSLACPARPVSARALLFAARLRFLRCPQSFLSGQRVFQIEDRRETMVRSCGNGKPSRPRE